MQAGCYSEAALDLPGGCCILQRCCQGWVASRLSPCRWRARCDIRGCRAWAPLLLLGMAPVSPWITRSPNHLGGQRSGQTRRQQDRAGQPGCVKTHRVSLTDTRCTLFCPPQKARRTWPPRRSCSVSKTSTRIS